MKRTSYTFSKSSVSSVKNSDPLNTISGGGQLVLVTVALLLLLLVALVALVVLVVLVVLVLAVTNVPGGSDAKITANRCLKFTYTLRNTVAFSPYFPASFCTSYATSKSGM